MGSDKGDPRVIDVNDERRFMLCWIVHLSDISNCAKSLKSGKKWAVRVMTEFFKQGDRERALGLEVSAMMDRRRSSTPQGQIGFIKFILRPSYNMFVRLVPEASKPLEILNENLEYWQIQQKLMNQDRKKRARSVGSINQAPVLLMMQDQLKMLNDKVHKNEDEEEEVDDDNISQKSVQIKDDMTDDDIIGSPIVSTTGNQSISMDIPIPSSPQKEGKRKSSKKHVGFKDILIIEKETEIIENEELIMDTPRTLSSRSLNINIEPSDSHHVADNSGYSGHSGHSSRRSRNTDLSIESLDSTPLTNKLRAHSIHVSIPTSEKQIQSQPQPFTEFLAELRKTEDEKYQKEQNRKKKWDRTNNTKQQNQSNKQPKVTQSVSIPKNRNVGAKITVSDTEQSKINNSNNSNNNNKNKKNNSNNKQVFDVV